jgi:hypothetical protein
VLFGVPGIALTAGRPFGSPLERTAVGAAAALAALPIALYLVSLAGVPIEWWTLAGVAVALTAAGIALARTGALGGGTTGPVGDEAIALPPWRSRRFAVTAAGSAVVVAFVAWRLEPIVAVPVFGAYSAAVLAVFAWPSLRPGARRAAHPEAVVLPVLPGRVLAPVTAGLLAGGAGSRLLLFAYNRVPLGFDSGIYRGLQDAWAAALPGIPSFAEGSHESQQEPGLFLLTDVLHLSGWSTDATLWGLLIGLQVLMALGLWLLARDLGGPLAGLWALLLFAVSSTQLTAFWHVYYKQVLALTLLLYLLWLWRRQSWLVVPIGALLAGTHNMTLLLVGLVLLTDFLWPSTAAAGNFERPRDYLSPPKRFQLVAGALILALGLTLYTASPAPLTDYVSANPITAAQGVGLGGDGQSATAFLLDVGAYLRLAALIVPFALVTALTRLGDASARPVILMAVWAVALLAAGITFSERYVIALDLALIVLAAPALATATALLWPRWIGRTALAAGAGVGIAAFLLTFSERGPLIPQEQLAAIEDARAVVPTDAYFMATHISYSAWVFGYGERDTIAPGLFQHDRWAADEWPAMWDPPTPEARYALLDRYDRPLYIHIGANQRAPSFQGDERFESVAPDIWRYVPAAEAGTR